MALEGQTPVQVAGIGIEGKNRMQLLRRRSTMMPRMPGMPGSCPECRQMKLRMKRRKVNEDGDIIARHSFAVIGGMKRNEWKKANQELLSSALGQRRKSPVNGTEPENRYLTLIYDKNTISIHCKLGSC
jgi:hypothetical protein